MLLDELETDPPPTVVQLAALHERHRLNPRYAREVAEAMVSGSRWLERGGGFLLRRLAGETGTLPAEEWELVIDGLDGVRSWFGRLLLCQTLAEWPALMDVAPADLAMFLRGCLSDPKPTVRAWSFCALNALAERHPEYLAEARAAEARARRDRAPCVVARLRQMGLVPYPPKKKMPGFRRRRPCLRR